MKNNTNKDDAFWKNFNITDLNDVNETHSVSVDPDILNNNMNSDDESLLDDTQNIDGISDSTSNSKPSNTAWSNPSNGNPGSSSLNANSTKSTVSKQTRNGTKSCSNQNNKQKGRNKSSNIKPVSSILKSTSNISGKAVKAGGSVVKGSFSLTSSVAKSAFRIATIILMIVTMFLIFNQFWKNYSSLGTLNSIVNAQNYSLAAYLGVGFILFIFELFSLLRASTSLKMIDNGHVIRYDTGRGMFSFPIIYAGSFLAAHYCSLIPGVHPAVTGVQTALNLYGSMQETLLKICILGLITCLARWIFSRLQISLRKNTNN